MRICVVGGNGFIGSHVIDELHQLGHKVIVYDRQDERYRPRQTDIKYVYGELGNHGRLVECLAGVDHVVHLASSTTPKMSNEDMLLDVEQNLVGTLRLLEACVEQRVRRVVFISSGGTVYGIPRKLPISEDHPTDPISSYGIIKLTIEKFLALYAQLHGLDYRILRPTNPYGERQNPLGEQGIISVFLWRAIHRQPLVVFGDGNTIRDYLFISDLSHAICLAMNHHGQPRVFNVGSGQGHSINELVEAIAKLFDYPLKVEWQPLRLFDVPRVVLNNHLLQREMSWRPQITLEEGLQRTKDWLANL